jgi:two-component sensor histidine kinase
VFGVAGQNTPLDSIDLLLAKRPSKEKQRELLFLAAETALKEDSTVNKVKSYTAALREMEGFGADSTLVMNALKLDAHAHRIIGNFSSSIAQFQLCHGYFAHVADTTNLAFTANQLGSMYVFMGQNEKAQHYLLQVYNIHKAQGNRRMLASATNGLAIFYNNINQVEKAIARYEEALSMFQEVKDTMGQANVHANLGITYVDQGEFSKAEYHIGMQGKLDSLLNTQWGLGFYFDYLGYLREKQGRYKEAYQNHLQSLKIREQLSSHYNVTESRISLANNLLKLERYNEAIEEGNKVFDNYEERNSLYHQQSAYHILSQGYEAKKEMNKALAYHKLYKKISDSIFNTDMLEAITEKDAKFESVQKVSEIALLNLENDSSQKIIGQKNRTILMGGTGLFLVSLLCLGLYLITRKYLRQRKRLALTLSQKDILLREIHHRVKNNLQLVSSLLTLQGRSIDNATVQQAINEGKSRIRSMALIHQDLYQKENLTAVSAQHYFSKLCQELFDTYNISNDKIRLITNIDDIHIDVDTLVPLGLITNEILSNSLKYAFPENKKGELRIGLNEKIDHLVLIVSDDGVGYDPKKIPSNSFGNNLIESLTQQLEGKLSISTTKGTTIRIEIYDYKTTDHDH